MTHKTFSRPQVLDRSLYRRPHFSNDCEEIVAEEEEEKVSEKEFSFFFGLVSFRAIRVTCDQSHKTFCTSNLHFGELSNCGYICRES